MRGKCRPATSRQRYENATELMKGHPPSRRRSYTSVMVACAVMLALVILTQRPGRSTAPPMDGAKPTRHARYAAEKAAAESSLREAVSGSSRRGSAGNLKYAVVVDAGSTGSRIHAFKFLSSGSDLLLEDSIFSALEPGLSSYSANPEAAADSLRPLLEKARDFVPASHHALTSVEVRATAGLRLLPGDQATAILDAVRHLLSASYPFFVPADAVSVLEGSDEGVFMWVTSNYYLGRIGKPSGETVSVVDLGGGSVQRAFAIQGPAPPSVPAESVKRIQAAGQSYDVYVHSYLGFGLKASRKTFLAPYEEVDAGHPCLHSGFVGRYAYGGESVIAKSQTEGADVTQCLGTMALEMRLDEPCGVASQCSFDGVWSGGGGPGAKENFVSSYLVDMAGDVGIIPRKSDGGRVRAGDFLRAAQRLCPMEVEAAATAVPKYLNGDGDKPYVCMDLLYAYKLLKDGFDFPEEGEFSLVKRFDYKGQKVEAAWPLGAAIHTVGTLPASSSSSY